MKTILEQMVENYEINNNEEKRNAVKEVMQEIVLCGLSKAGFFKEVAFYGETALRIFYGLDRFSEDLDFALIVKNCDFNLNSYFSKLESTVNSFGLKVGLELKSKTKDSDIQSAFLKGDTVEHFLLFYPNDKIVGINPDEKIKIKIKIKIDTCPPALAAYETKYRLLPTPYSVKIYDEASLFSGKIHAVLCRAWKARVKGRDLYDYVFYLQRNARFNLPHLNEKLRESLYISKGEVLTLEEVKQLLIKRFDEIDFDEAKKDVMPFIKNKEILEIWSDEFFIDITEQLRCND